MRQLAPFFNQHRNTHQLQFDGVDEFVDFGNIADFDSNEAFSITGFYEPSVLDSRHFIVTKVENTVDFKGWQILKETDNTVQFLLANKVSPANFIFKTTDTTLLLDTKVHLAITYDGSEDESGVNIYFNSVLQAMTSLGNTLSATTLNTSDLEFGRRSDASGHLLGFLDEVAVWDKELSLTEIQSVFNNAKSISLNRLSFASNLIVWTPFTQTDKTNFPIIKDFSVNNNDGIANNMEALDIVRN